MLRALIWTISRQETSDRKDLEQYILALIQVRAFGEEIVLAQAYRSLTVPGDLRQLHGEKPQRQQLEIACTVQSRIKHIRRKYLLGKIRNLRSAAGCYSAMR